MKEYDLYEDTKALKSIVRHCFELLDTYQKETDAAIKALETFDMKIAQVYYKYIDDTISYHYGWEDCEKAMRLIRDTFFEYRYKGETRDAESKLIDFHKTLYEDTIETYINCAADNKFDTDYCNKALELLIDLFDKLIVAEELCITINQ